MARAPRLVPREQFCGRPPAGLILEIDIGERLPVSVLDDEAGGEILDRPGRREAAGCEMGSLQNLVPRSPAAAVFF